MKNSFIAFALALTVASSVVAAGCSSTPKKETTANAPVTAPATPQEQPTALASNANLGASSSGRGR